MLAFPGHISDRLAWRVTYAMISVMMVVALLLLLTPWFPTDEWPCSSEGFADASANLQTNCTVDTNCTSMASYALYEHSTCSEKNVCVYSAKKACHTPINSTAFHRVIIVVHLGCWPLFVGIVAVLFRKLKWKGSRMVGAGTAIILILQQIQTAFGWFAFSLGTKSPWCSAEWAGFVCHDEEITKIYFVFAKSLGFILLCVFARIAVWVSKLRNKFPISRPFMFLPSAFTDKIQDTIVSYQKQHPIRSAPGYVMALSVLIMIFPYACAALMRTLIDFMGR
jgi:hypothetical protein